MAIRKIEPIRAAVLTEEQENAMERVLDTVWSELEKRFHAKKTHHEDTTLTVYDNIGYRGEMPVYTGTDRVGTAFRLIMFLKSRGFKVYSGWFRGNYGWALTKKTCTIMILLGADKGTTPIHLYTWVADDERGLMINAPTSDFKVHKGSDDTVKV